MNNGPDPNLKYPIPNQTRLVYLKNIIKNPNIIVGDYTYYDDFENPENFERNVLYNFDFIEDQLIIGKFCSIASDVKFIMNGGNHRTDWLTNYPFPVFGEGWEKAMPDSWPDKGNTVISNDVWIGYGAIIMPGIQVGDGAIIATNSVVTKNVEPYSIVGGNPAKEIRKRFEEAIIKELLEIKWWDWEIEKITRNLQAICGSDINELRETV
ncbi:MULTISPECIES: CatB-related O-acetyltransferase [Okeania]|uniref:Antibiotic acetyltransferase n=1 Tax=Okeania hirsuta TaxID=1458930 RepID=A0A3N6PI65_9CYAN|nr:MULTISPECIES: CatB-related O-acetyltransferase [Okeania]NEP06728.1 CatB-related O-acetyltransferase [Okeania sp. SIO4D6]NEP46317.1 CatB-related O-acetyltransferase [Okeania sp. SIO2H7]NET14834.1 CatB-related O-acetyltransferase [Okeania sp. SIO1H6]NEP76148.1 CatB-related O-acetyltransferase [Okeania sp. SIO2G5]NEP97305.1 CatB-related O-acetyltransferase [Okeania sp. SIO2F5]